MRTLNLGILAHVDAGKTSLTERLLFTSGVIQRLGSVDAGSTQTDTMALEQQRGITIKSAVVSFVIGDVTVNLIDTPGHPDFVAEVERVLGVLDGAVLVISAVEGVQAQTRVLMRALRRLGIPTLVFVNKIDRSGAQGARLLTDIADALTPGVLAMGAVTDQGSPSAGFEPYGDADAAFAARLTDLLTTHDETLLADCVDDGTDVSSSRLRRELAAQTRRMLVNPVFFGSAITGAGVDALMAGLAELLPVTDGEAEGPASGTVFKVDRGPAGEKIAYVRLFSGTVRVREQLRLGPDREGKVTAISVFDRGSSERRTSAAAGAIARIWGLGRVRIGDVIGAPRTGQVDHHFSAPTLETVVDPCRPADRGSLHVALTQLAEQDPLINLRQDTARREISVSLYGEVQKEVIQATLADGYGVDVTFRETTTIFIERPVGSGAAVEVIAQEPNPFLATVGLRVDPAPNDGGVQFRLEVELGSMPPAFFAAVEEAVRETLRQGLNGWEVSGCTVTMTHSGYWARQSHSHGSFDASMSSTAGDFRNLTPLVLMSALKQAGTRVYEPMHRFELEIPTGALGPTLAALAPLRAVPRETVLRGGSYLLTGQLPAAQVHELRKRLPGLTHGAGTLVSSFERHQPVVGAVATRRRTDHDPLDRREYLLRVARRA